MTDLQISHSVKIVNTPIEYKDGLYKIHYQIKVKVTNEVLFENKVISNIKENVIEKLYIEFCIVFNDEMKEKVRIILGK